MALAIRIAQNSNLKVCNSVFLENIKTGNTMVERMFSEPVYSGDIPTSKYIIVDDVYTTGQTLKSLKNFLESKGANVTSAWCLGSGPSTQFEPNRLLIKILLTRFPSISNYFDIDSLTVPQISYLLRLSSINRLWQIHSDNQLALSFA